MIGTPICQASHTLGETGMQVTIKDADELYVWGGRREINGTLYRATSQITVDASGLAAGTKYFLYVNAPASGTTLSAANFTISLTAKDYDHSKGADYMTGDGTKRYLADFKTA
jgi:hypothetical protein